MNNTNVNEQKQVEQKQTRRNWPLVALVAILMYIAPTVNSILQQLIAAKWTIVISISGFQLNLILLISEIIFMWIVMGVCFLIGMFTLPDMIASILLKRKMSRPVRVVLTIVFPLMWVWNYLFKKWYYRNE